MIKKPFLLPFFWFVCLTVVTQIGGLVYMIALWLSSILKVNFKGGKFSVFIILYSCTTFLIIPYLAPLFGREKIAHTRRVKPTNYLTVLLNRNYVVPKMNRVLQITQDHLPNEVEIHYLDACFPFVDGFPLIPHLSHKDGKKLDLSFVYTDHNGVPSNKEKSLSGYGVYVEPTPLEINQTANCKKAGHWQYDMTKYIRLAKINEDIQFSPNYTKQLITHIIKQPEVKKVFIEPHLKERMKLHRSKVRFHGCHAVRHDDHIHLELF